MQLVSQFFKTDSVPSYSESEVSSAKDEGIATVTNDSASYSLVSNPYDQALLDANEKSKPSQMQDLPKQKGLKRVVNWSK